MPLSIFGGKSQKTAFSKMAAIGSERSWMFHLWSYFDKQKVNFALFWHGDSISDIYFTLNIFLTMNSIWRPQTT